MSKKSLFLVTSILALPMSGQSFAASDATGGIQEIVVTAQRRTESVLSVPLSIQAISGEQLTNLGIKDLDSLQYVTPGYLPQSAAGFTSTFIRGVGNAIFTGADPSVAINIDDVPRVFATMDSDLPDVERIEVLKGAQGGLYGRNATGGVINIITRQPSTDSFKGFARISYGEKNTFRASGFLNVPLNDKVAVNLAGERDSHDAYVKNLAVTNPYTAAMFPVGSRFGTSQQTANYFNSAVGPVALNNQDYWTVRGKILIKPSDNFKAVIAADFWQKDDSNGYGTTDLTPAFTQNSIAAFFRAIGVTASLPAGFITGPTAAYTSASGAAGIHTKFQESGASATLTWNAPGFDLTSISAYRHQRTYSDGPFASPNVPDIMALVKAPYKNFFYQEVRAISTFDGPFHVLGGATYLDDRQHLVTNIFLLGKVNSSNTDVKDNVKNWSVYAQVGYDFTSQLSLTVSGRYQHETNSAFFTVPVVSQTHSSEQKFTPSVTLNYKLPDDGSAYARWARGFKSGGVTLAAAPFYFPTTEGSIFAPETVDLYEVGYRQALFDRKINVTGAIFYNDYKNVQVSSRGNPANPQITSAVTNAKSARTYGAEGSVTVKVSEPLTIGTSFGYLNAKYKDYNITSSVLAASNRSGTQMTHAPKWQMSFNANLDQPVGDQYRLIATVVEAHKTADLFVQSASPGVLPDAIVPAYWLTNARIGVKTTDDKYGLFLVADNLFNAKVYGNANSLSSGNVLAWGSPRIIRGELQVNF